MPRADWLRPEGSDATKEQTKAFRRASAVKTVKPVELPRWAKNPPATYHKVNKPLPKVSLNSKKSALFADGVGGMHNKPLVERRGIRTFGTIVSDSPQNISFLRDVVKAANERLPVDLDSDEMFTTTGVPTTFDRALCIANYHQLPMSYKMVRNDLFRESLGLSAGYTPRQRAIAEEFWDLAWSTGKIVPVNVTKMSQGGIRRFSKSAQWKLDFAEWIMEQPRFEAMLNAVAREDWLTLANEFEMVFLMYIQKRVQVDSPEKVRYANDLLYAITGGLEGVRIETDKKVIIDGQEYPDFSALRIRVVDAGPWVINLWLQIPSSMCMHSLFERFPKTFHVNTDEEIEEVCNGREIYCSDVSEYDQSMSQEAMEIMLSKMAEYWDERIVKAARRLYCSPYYARPVWPHDPKRAEGDPRSKGQWVGDPRDWKTEMWGGNRSGHAATSLMAKGNKVIESLFIIDKIYPVLGNVRSFLLHQQPIVLVNNGDDEIAGFDNDQDYADFKKYRVDKSVGHYVVSPEKGQGYSGRYVCKIGRRRYKCKPRLTTPLEKMFVPEHEWRSALYAHPGLGAMVRVNDLSKTEEGNILLDCILSSFSKNFPGMNFMGTILSDIELDPIQIDGLTRKDQEVLMDPSKLHYKYRIDEINPEVVELSTSKIPVQATEKIARRYYRGLIH